VSAISSDKHGSSHGETFQADATDYVNLKRPSYYRQDHAVSHKTYKKWRAGPYTLDFFTQNISHAHKHKTKQRGAHTLKIFHTLLKFCSAFLTILPEQQSQKHQTNRTLGRTTDGSGKRKVHGWQTTGERGTLGVYSTKEYSVLDEKATVSFRMDKTRV
jgi:hypothetical protein